MKHAKFAYQNSECPSRIPNKFNHARAQLKNIRKEECRLFTLLGTENGAKELIKIALETIVFYQNSEPQNKKESWRKTDFTELFEKMITEGQLEKVANMKALWILNQSLARPGYLNMNHSRIFPAVAFIGNISKGQTD